MNDTALREALHEVASAGVGTDVDARVARLASRHARINGAPRVASRVVGGRSEHSVSLQRQWWCCSWWVSSR